MNFQVVSLIISDRELSGLEDQSAGHAKSDDLLPFLPGSSY
jgi:hypothetical protein